MTASPGREVDANLLRGAAPGSAQRARTPQDAGGQDLGDLVEALGGGHLTISYRHNRATGEPLFAGNEIAACVARDVRQQLTRGDDSVLAIDLERLTRVRAMRVNDITYELEWSTDAPVSDDRGKPVLGVCEVDPDGLPDTALICVNPDPVEGRTELLLSTGAHEMGHGIFEAPAWIYAHQRRSMPTLFDVADPAAPRRVWRTTTPNESHFSATYPPGPTSSSRRPGRTSSWARC